MAWLAIEWALASPSNSCNCCSCCWRADCRDESSPLRDCECQPEREITLMMTIVLKSGLTSSSRETSAYPKALASSHRSFDTDSTLRVHWYKYSMNKKTHILVYSGTPLLRTPWGPGEVSCIERCPHLCGKFILRKHIWDIAKCP